jgi:hypothetical protein
MSSEVETSHDVSEIVGDSSTPLGMTKALSFAILTTFVAAIGLPAQESPPPSPGESASPSQTASATARSVPLRFVPPPMEGTISLGIWDSDDKLVRVLHRESRMDNFAIDENSLKTDWDGKSDTGEDLPAGKYRARGYLVGTLKVDDLGKVASPPADAADRLSVRLLANPLNSDTGAVMEIGIAFDSNGSFLKTTDGLPLATVRAEPNLTRVAIEKSGERAAEVWQDGGAGVEHLRVSSIDKIMAFDCGFFELK